MIFEIEAAFGEVRPTQPTRHHSMRALGDQRTLYNHTPHVALNANRLFYPG